MNIYFANPFKHELKLALLTIYYSKHETEYNTIMYGISVIILNLTISHHWVVDKK